MQPRTPLALPRQPLRLATVRGFTRLGNVSDTRSSVSTGSGSAWRKFANFRQLSLFLSLLLQLPVLRAYWQILEKAKKKKQKKKQKKMRSDVGGGRSPRI